MAYDKAALGSRYSCFSCGCKFYDLNRPEPLCPKCGANQKDDPNPKGPVLQLSAKRGRLSFDDEEEEEEEDALDLSDDVDEEDDVDDDVEDEGDGIDLSEESGSLGEAEEEED